MNGPAEFNSLPARSKTSESVTSFSTVSSDFSDIEYKSEGNTAIHSPRGSNLRVHHGVEQHSQPSKSKREQSALSLKEPHERNRLQSAPSNCSVFDERDVRIDQAWNPRASVAFNDAIGLLNPCGENNCFLNSAIQVLWHLDAFRRNFRVLSGHWCLQNSCIFCALKVIFTQFQFSEHQALPPDALRLALAESFADQHRFQLGQMDDAAECFETILGRIHFHLAWDVQEDRCQIAHCLPHQKFAMFLVEQLVCGCGETSEPFLFNQIVYYVSTTAVETCLRTYKISGRSPNDVSFGVLLFDAKNFGENRPCPSNCGEIAETRQTLANTPEVITIGFSWSSDHAGRSHIRKILRAISVDLHPSELVYSVADDNWGKLTVAKLVGLVCYQGRHYSTFIFHSKLKTWILFDDDRVREIGPEWNALVELCILGNYQPLLLLYSDPRGVPIDASTAPVNRISLCDEALNTSGIIQRCSRSDADAKEELRSAQSQAKCDVDSRQESEFESDEFVDCDAASKNSQMRFQDENHDHTDQTGYASNRNHSFSCPDGLCTADRNEDSQTYIDKNILTAHNLRELAVHRHSQDAADSSNKRLMMVGKENLIQRPFVAETKRNVTEERVFGRVSGKTKPVFDTTYGRKSVAEDRFLSVKSHFEQPSFACVHEACEKYITYRQNRFSSASAVNPLCVDHSVRPSTDSSSLNIAFPVGNNALIGHRTLPNKTVVCRTTPAAFNSNPSTDAFAYQAQNSSDRWNNFTVASNSTPSLHPKKFEHRSEGKCENCGRAGENFDPVRKPQNTSTSRKIEHWNFTSSNHEQFDKPPDATSDSDLYQNPIQDYVQADRFSSDHDRQLFRETIKLLKQSDDFVELSRKKLETGDVTAAAEHCKDASRFLKKAGQHRHLHGTLESLFRLSLQNFKDIRQEIDSWFTSSLKDYKLNCQIEHSNGDVVSVEKSRQQERLLTGKNSRAEWDENMNKTSDPLPGSDRGPVFYLSGHRKLGQSGDLKTCDTDLAQKMISAPCRSFPGASSTRCSSTSEQYGINRNQNSNKVSAPVYSSASSLPRHRTLSSSHSSILSILRAGSSKCEDPAEASRRSKLTTLQLQGRGHDRKPWR